MTVQEPQVHELILQALTHEKGGVQVYQTALECVLDTDLQKEWQEYLEQTTHHVEVLEQVCAELKLDSGKLTPGCEVVQFMGESLVEAMRKAKAAGTPEAAQLVACECVVLAETKDHQNWELMGMCATQGKGALAKVLKTACDEVEDEEDEHLYHSKGWCRELWIESLGMRAVLPPPEERKDVKTAIGAARAEQARDKMK
jgi:hypothetical protein